MVFNNPPDQNKLPVKLSKSITCYFPIIFGNATYFQKLGIKAQGFQSKEE
jgi:hypothetical protein